MRTTLSIDQDNAKAIRRLLGQAKDRGGRSLKRVINDLLRAGLRWQQEFGKHPEYRVELVPVNFRGGLDLGHLNSLAAREEHGDEEAQYRDKNSEMIVQESFHQTYDSRKGEKS